MTGTILLIAFLLIMVSIPVWFAIWVKQHPEKDRGMRRVMEEQRCAEYEAGMQKFLMVNYISTGIAWVVAALIEIVFHLESFLPHGLLVWGFAWGWSLPNGVLRVSSARRVLLLSPSGSCCWWFI